MTNEPKPSFFRSFTGTLAAIAIGVIGASVVALPAAYLAPLVASAADGKVSLTNATGRVWEGRGDLTIALAGPPIALRGLQWTVRPLRLFAGELCLDVTVPGPEVQGRAQIARGFSSLFVRDAAFTVPAALVSSRSPWLQSWDASGTVDITARSFEMNAKRLVGDGEINLKSIAAARLGSLGDFRIAASPAGERTNLNIATTAGALKLNGTGDLGVGGDLKLRGTATTDAENRPRLGAFLAILGPTQADGSVPFQWPIFGAAGGGAPSAPIQRRGAALNWKTLNLFSASVIGEGGGIPELFNQLDLFSASVIGEGGGIPELFGRLAAGTDHG